MDELTKALINEYCERIMGLLEDSGSSGWLYFQTERPDGFEPWSMLVARSPHHLMQLIEDLFVTMGYEVEI